MPMSDSNNPYLGFSNEVDEKIAETYHLLEQAAGKVSAVLSTVWDDIFVSSILEAKHHSNIGQGIKLIAMIRSIGDPFPYTANDGSKHTMLPLSLMDHFGQIIECIPVEHNPDSVIVESFESGSYLKFHGTICEVTKKNETYFAFQVWQCIGEITAKERMSISPKDIGPTQALIDQIASSGKSPFQFICIVLSMCLHSGSFWSSEKSFSRGAAV